MSASSSLSRACAAIAGGLGLLGLAAAATSVFLQVPVVLRHASLGTSVVEVAIAAGLYRRRRAAWAFALALEGTVTLMNLLGLAEVSRAPSGAAVMGLMLARAILFALLAASSREFR